MEPARDVDLSISRGGLGPALLPASLPRQTVQATGDFGHEEVRDVRPREPVKPAGESVRVGLLAGMDDGEE